MPVGPTGNNAAIQSVAMQDLHSVTSTRSSRRTLWTSAPLVPRILPALASAHCLFLRLWEHGFRPVESAYSSSNNGEAEEAQVVMHGTLHDSDKDYAVIDTTIVAA
jgi:hypothetical protein